MTAPVTASDGGKIDNPSPQPEEGGAEGGQTGRAPDARAREANQKIAVTQGYRKVGAWIGARRVAAARWWAWVERPLSLRAVWRLSAVDPTRAPATGRWKWLLAWRISNGVDRLAWFALMLLLPPVLQGPLRWAAVRPTRRVGTYLLIALLVAAFLVKAG